MWQPGDPGSDLSSPHSAYFSVEGVPCKVLSPGVAWVIKWAGGIPLPSPNPRLFPGCPQPPACRAVLLLLLLHFLGSVMGSGAHADPSPATLHAKIPNHPPAPSHPGLGVLPEPSPAELGGTESRPLGPTALATPTHPPASLS